MRILLISPQPFFRVRGTPINILNMVTALANGGHEVDLLCYPFGDDRQIPGVRILRSPRVPGIRDVKVGPSLAKIPLDMLMAFSTLRRVMGSRYDVVHAVEESVFFAGPLARLRRIPFVYDMDSLISDQLAYSGFLSWRPLLRGVEWLERRAIRSSTAVVTVCRSLTDAARRLDESARVVQIEDAPLQSSFCPDPEGAAALVRDHRIPEGSRIVYTGNFEAYQGLEMLVDSMVDLIPACPDVVLILVGGEDRHRVALRERAREKGVLERICFTGPLPMERMPACMTLADVLVSPRVKGTNTALKLYGYMQTSKPIVATRLETHTQVLDDTCAWLCDRSPDSLAAALNRALSEKDLSQDKGREAARRVEEMYGLDRFHRQILDLYAGLDHPPGQKK